jgi:hypothetical protein
MPGGGKCIVSAVEAENASDCQEVVDVFDCNEVANT